MNVHTVGLTAMHMKSSADSPMSLQLCSDARLPTSPHSLSCALPSPAQWLNLKIALAVWWLCSPASLQLLQQIKSIHLSQVSKHLGRQDSPPPTVYLGQSLCTTDKGQDQCAGATNKTTMQIYHPLQRCQGKETIQVWVNVRSMFILGWVGFNN